MAIKQFASLSTSFVSLAALIHYLREQEFKGTLRIALHDYEAEVLLNGSKEAVVLEVDPSSRVTSQTDGAMERLLVHAREPGGVITVHEDAAKAKPSFSVEAGPVSTAPSDFPASYVAGPDDEEIDWEDLLQASAELIQAVEHAVKSTGTDFEASFRSARIEMGDDYPFLDPSVSNLSYAAGVATLSEQPTANVYVTGLSECLRRVVNKLAIGKDSKRFRERVAVEITVAARMRTEGLGEFTAYLDRIAGTRVI